MWRSIIGTCSEADAVLNRTPRSASGSHIGSNWPSIWISRTTREPWRYSVMTCRTMHNSISMVCLRVNCAVENFTFFDKLIRTRAPTWQPFLLDNERRKYLILSRILWSVGDHWYFPIFNFLHFRSAYSIALTLSLSSFSNSLSSFGNSGV